MIVVMKTGSSPQQVEHVVKLVREMGLKENVIIGRKIPVGTGAPVEEDEIFETVEE